MNKTSGREVIVDQWLKVTTFGITLGMDSAESGETGFFTQIQLGGRPRDGSQVTRAYLYFDDTVQKHTSEYAADEKLIRAFYPKALFADMLGIIRDALKAQTDINYGYTEDRGGTEQVARHAYLDIPQVAGKKE